MNRRTLLWGLLGVVGFTILIQFVPVPGLGKDPPVVAEPAWNNAATRELAVRACYDCHSNQTKWPWYSRIAPVSWVVAHHVAEGRGWLDFSNPAAARVSAERASRAVTSHTMPPFYYTWMHPGASLSTTERQTLAEGLLTSLGGAVGQELAPVPSPSRVVPPDDMAPLPASAAVPSDAGARPVPSSVTRSTSPGTAGKTATSSRSGSGTSAPSTSH